MAVSVVAANTTFENGEGPHWEEGSQSLIYVDIMRGDVHRLDAATGQDSKLHVADDDVSFIIPRRSGGYLTSINKTIVHLDWETGSTKTLHEVDAGTKNRFNDAKCDPAGRLWAGTMGREVVPLHPEKEVAGLYCMDKDGSIKKHVDRINISNGLAWSADNSLMYYIDSLPRKVYVFDYDITTGTPSNQRTLIDFGEGTEATLGYPDGMCIDTDDKLWVACYSVGKVVRFDPITGAKLQHIEFPAKRTTSCCWGGRNFDELYVTCGCIGASQEELKQFPLSGSVFKVTGLGTRGTAASVFEG